MVCAIDAFPSSLKLSPLAKLVFTPSWYSFNAVIGAVKHIVELHGPAADTQYIHVYEH